MNRTISFNRHQAQVKSQQRFILAKSWNWDVEQNRFRKNGILSACSCHMCSVKANPKSGAKRYHYGLKHSERTQSQLYIDPEFEGLVKGRIL